MSETSKHTPGPWIVAPKKHGTIYPGSGREPVTYEKPHRDINQASDNSAVAEVHGNDEEAQANARLIAAAPEMYQFIEEMARRYPKSPWITQEAEAILAKVKTEV